MPDLTMPGYDINWDAARQILGDDVTNRLYDLYYAKVGAGKKMGFTARALLGGC